MLMNYEYDVKLNMNFGFIMNSKYENNVDEL